MKKLILILLFSSTLYAQNFTQDEALIGRLYKTIVGLQIQLDNLTKENQNLKEQIAKAK